MSTHRSSHPWGNTPLPTSSGCASFDHNVASSHTQSRSFQGFSAPPVPTSHPSEAPPAYPTPISPVQIGLARPIVTTAPPFTVGASSSTSRYLLHRGAPLAAPAYPPQLNISGPAQDYHHRTTPSTPAPSDTSVNEGRLSHSGSHGRQPGVDYNLPSPTWPSLGRHSRSPSRHYYPPIPQPPAAWEGARLPVDASPGTRQRCIIPDCQYQASYNIAEQEQMEYCGFGHEFQAIESGFAKPCPICRRRPRRSGERVCGRVCREQERQALQVQGSYSVPVTRRDSVYNPLSRTDPPDTPSGGLLSNREPPIVPIVPTAPVPVIPAAPIVPIVPTAPTAPIVPMFSTVPLPPSSPRPSVLSPKLSPVISL